ncbi:MAG: hypothetical protein HQM08_06965 [Candidatus Riflebacteria bacterium]|nr:hypothetical protein [Candidatus Riflebacteria bacterium]
MISMLTKQIQNNPARGFVLPVILGLIAIMMTFGAGYYFSTVQSKNVFQIFFRDETTRIIAESALAEWRATFLTKRIKDPKIKNLLQNPKSPPVIISIDDLPRTKELANELVYPSRWEFSGKVSLQNIDNELWETVGGIKKRGAFGNEYQGTIKLNFSIGLGASHRSLTNSNFSFEFDFKNVCLRTQPSDRINRGYTSTALNDYVLYVRDGKQEFSSPIVWAANNSDRTLTIGHSDTSKKGKIFLGDSDSSEMAKNGKFIFTDSNEYLESKFPTPPLIGRTGPLDFSRFLPFTSSLVRSFTFKNSKEFFSSPFCDGKTLKLNGIYIINDSSDGLIVPKGLQYEGKGILISLGDIKFEGSFKKKSPAEGPCIFYTWIGNIIANTIVPGKIEASLVALRYNYDPSNPNSQKSSVNFSNKKADIFGNLIVDRLNLESMATTQNNTILYDSDSLSGEEIYSSTFGGQLRRMGLVFNDKI